MRKNSSLRSHLYFLPAKLQAIFLLSPREATRTVPLPLKAWPDSPSASLSSVSTTVSSSRYAGDGHHTFGQDLVATNSSDYASSLQPGEPPTPKKIGSRPSGRHPGRPP